MKLMSRLIPESPSWLLVKGRTKEALDQLERVARFNKADLQVHLIFPFFVLNMLLTDLWTFDPFHSCVPDYIL